jgi:hypothetical protein
MRPLRVLALLVAVVSVGLFSSPMAVANHGDDPIVPVPESIQLPSLDAPTVAPYVPGVETVLTSGDGMILITVPAGAINEAALIEYSPQKPLDSTAVQVFRQFKLTARAAADPTRFLKSFNQPVTISLRYGVDDVRGLDDRTFQLSHLNEALGRWEALPTEHDVIKRTLTATTNHFSIFAGRANPIYALPGFVQHFQADLHSGSAVFSYPIQLPAIPGGALPGIGLAYDSGGVNETKNHRDVASWTGTGWNLTLPYVFFNEELNKYYLQMNGLFAELKKDSNGVWYTRPDLNLKVDRSPATVHPGGMGQSKQYRLQQ